MLTRDQLLYIHSQGAEAMIAVIEAMMAAMEAMRNQVEELEKKVEELENEKAKNSRNSGKPPTSDGLKKVVKSLREKSGKKAGGQVGHKGKGMERVAEPDEVVVHGVEECGHCGEDLREEAVRRVERRQVVEVPEVKVKVVEHQGEHKRCPKCGKETVGKFPAGVENVVQYGPRLKATAVYLVQEQHVPVGRTKQTLKDLVGCEMSAGSVMNAVRECSERVKPEVERIKEEIREAVVGDFDETGLRVKKALMWLHVAGSEELTYYEVQPGRGIKAIEAIDILPKFEGVAVHDAYAAYLAYDGKHALCNAHLLRELIFVAEQLKQAWATELIKLLLEIKARVAEAAAGGWSDRSSPLLGRPLLRTHRAPFNAVGSSLLNARCWRTRFHNQKMAGMHLLMAIRVKQDQVGQAVASPVDAILEMVNVDHDNDSYLCSAEHKNESLS